MANRVAHSADEDIINGGGRSRPPPLEEGEGKEGQQPLHHTESVDLDDLLEYEDVADDDWAKEGRRTSREVPLPYEQVVSVINAPDFPEGHNAGGDRPFRSIMGGVIKKRYHKRQEKTKKYVTWDMWTASLLVYTAVVTPFEVALLEISINALFFINRLVDLSFMGDIALSFTRPYQGKIVRHYLRTWFLVDVVSVLPYDIVGYAVDSEKAEGLKLLRLLRVLRLIKLLRVLRAGRIFHRVEASLPINYMLLELARFCIITLMISHWLACAWYMTVALQPGGGSGVGPESPVSWVNDYTFVDVDADPWSLYIVALYWSVATLSTLGYGDVVPTTDIERVFAIVATFVGSSVYAYMIGNVCGILAGMDIRKAHFYETMKALNVFMDEKKIPEGLRQRLRDYFLFRKKNTILQDWQTLIMDMSPLLREQVAHHVHARWVANVPTFSGAPRDFVAGLVMHLRHSTYSANEIVFKKGSTARYSYIVERGLVYVNEDKIYLKGQMLGEDMMYREGRRQYQATTLTHCVLLLLERGLLMSLLDEFPVQKRRLRRHVVRVIFRQAVFKYVRALKRLEKLGAEEAITNKEFLYHSSTMPILHEHVMAAMNEVDPTYLQKLVKATVLVQRWFRVVQHRKHKRALHIQAQETRKGVDKLGTAIDRLGLAQHYRPSLEAHMPTIDGLHGATSSHVCLMLMGVKFNDACSILKATEKEVVGVPAKGAKEGVGMLGSNSTTNLKQPMEDPARHGSGGGGVGGVGGGWGGGKLTKAKR